jgi:hypothetical protein
MKLGKHLRVGFSLIALAAFALVSTGCGELTIRTWVKIITEESDGQFEADVVPPQPPYPVERLQGGFLTVVELDTRDLPGALEGTLTLEEVRVAALEPALLGPFCNWNDVTGFSGGTVVMDILGGESETDVFLDAKGQAQLSAQIGMPPMDIETPVDFALGSEMGISAFLDALNSGTVDGMFASQTSVVTETEVLGIPLIVTLNLSLDNDGLPPLFDEDLLAFCGPLFDEQGAGLFYGLNPQSSYLLAENDKPVAPRVVSLAELGAAAGDTLRLTAVGTWADSTLFRDGNETRVTGVFSATDTVLPRWFDERIPDAIDAGSNYDTGHYWSCIGLICLPIPDTDIPEDFRIDPQVDVVVPAGAEYLIMAPMDRDLEYEDNTGLGFGVEIEVNP